MSSPTQRTLELFRKNGWTVAIVERWNPHARVRQDLFGFIDLVVLDATSIVGVQATSGTNHVARRKKILAEPRAKLWLQHGGLIWIVSWAKKGKRGKRKTWQYRMESIKLENFDA
jgi:hypothetical protein